MRPSPIIVILLFITFSVRFNLVEQTIYFFVC
jgi:hypothetical protein